MRLPAARLAVAIILLGVGLVVALLLVVRDEKPPAVAVAGPWVSRSPNVSYNVTSSSDAGELQCSFNGAAWARCPQRPRYVGRVGANSLKVRLLDDDRKEIASGTRWTQVDERPPALAGAPIAKGAVLAAPVSLTVSATDDYAVGSARVWVDSDLVAKRTVEGNVRSTPVSFSVDPGPLAPGRHDIRVEVTDKAGNRTAATSEFVAKRNTGGPLAGRLFAPNSVWNTPLKDDTPIDRRSEPIVNELLREVDKETNGGYGPWLNTTKFSTPFYLAAPDVPRVPVTIENAPKGEPLAGVLAKGVPIPRGAKPAAGTDQHFSIWQPATDTLWDLYGAKYEQGRWTVRWGGVIRNVSRHRGYYSDQKNARGQVVEQAVWGSSASSIPIMAGTITIAEAQQGSIDHTVAIAIPSACKGLFAWPAQRTDGYNTSPNCLPEGARLRLPPDLDIDRLNLPPFSRMLAIAAQRYGLVLRDQTSSIISFFGEDPTRFGKDVWRGPDAKSGLLGGYPRDILGRGFPWSRLQVLRMDLKR